MTTDDVDLARAEGEGMIDRREDPMRTEWTPEQVSAHEPPETSHIRGIGYGASHDCEATRRRTTRSAPSMPATGAMYAARVLDDCANRPMPAALVIDVCGTGENIIDRATGEGRR